MRRSMIVQHTGCFFTLNRQKVRTVQLRIIWKVLIIQTKWCLICKLYAKGPLKSIGSDLYDFLLILLQEINLALKALWLIIYTIKRFQFLTPRMIWDIQKEYLYKKIWDIQKYSVLYKEPKCTSVYILLIIHVQHANTEKWWDKCRL